VVNNCELTGVISVNEAFAILKDTLKRHGLKNVSITVSGHGLTQEESGSIARGIVAGGFGEGVRPAKEPVKRQFQESYFSWNTVSQKEDHIDLFFDLDNGSKSGAHSTNEKEVS
jgi:hypothetical protein